MPYCLAFVNSRRYPVRLAKGRSLLYTRRMYEVRVQADFSAAHFLRDYNGKCENLHGHNYKVFAHVRGGELNEGGMLLDFTLLKGALKKVCAALDHTNLNDNSFFEQNPSAERIAVFIYNNIIQSLKEQGIDLSKKAGGTDACAQDAGRTCPAYLCAVDVFETDTSRARYIPD